MCWLHRNQLQGQFHHCQWCRKCDVISATSGVIVLQTVCPDDAFLQRNSWFRNIPWSHTWDRLSFQGRWRVLRTKSDHTQRSLLRGWTYQCHKLQIGGRKQRPESGSRDWGGRARFPGNTGDRLHQGWFGFRNSAHWSGHNCSVADFYFDRVLCKSIYRIINHIFEFDELIIFKFTTERLKYLTTWRYWYYVIKI